MRELNRRMVMTNYNTASLRDLTASEVETVSGGSILDDFARNFVSFRMGPADAQTAISQINATAGGDRAQAERTARAFQNFLRNNPDQDRSTAWADFNNF
jgi:hypothetical protein